MRKFENTLLSSSEMHFERRTLLCDKYPMICLFDLVFEAQLCSDRKFLLIVTCCLLIILLNPYYKYVYLNTDVRTVSIYVLITALTFFADFFFQSTSVGSSYTWSAVWRLCVCGARARHGLLVITGNASVQPTSHHHHRPSPSLRVSILCTDWLLVHSITILWGNIEV